MDYGHWDISCVGEFDPIDYIGFVYIIEFGDGKKYIGSKKLWRRIDVAPGKLGYTTSSWKYYKSSQAKTKYKISTNKTSVVFKIISLHATYTETLLAESAEQKRCNVLVDKQYLNESIATTGADVTSRTSLSIAKKWQDDEYKNSMKEAQRNGKKKYWNNIYCGLIQSGEKKYSDYFPYVPTKEEHDAMLYEAEQRYLTKCSNISKGLMGRVLSDESRKKQRDAKLDKPLQVEHRNKIKQSLTGVPKSQEHARNAIAGRKRDETGKCIKRSIDVLIIDGIEYPSIRNAAIKLGVSEYIINSLIKRNHAIVIYKNK